MSTRRFTDIQFSQNHAIDGTRVQSAIDDLYGRMNSLPLEDIEKRHTLQTLILKCSGTSVQDLTPYSKAGGAVTGTDRPQAPFLDHAMLDTDNAATPAAFRAKGVPEAAEGQSFVWTASTFFLKPVTLESVTVHIDGTSYTPFSCDVYDITFTGAHGLVVSDKFITNTNNAWRVNLFTGLPEGKISQIFRVVQVITTTRLRAIWYSANNSVLPAPGLATVAAPHQLTVNNGTGVLTASTVVPYEAQATRILIDCPYLQYSTDRRLNSKVFSRQDFPERIYNQPTLSDYSPAVVDMYPLNIPFGPDGYFDDMRGIYYHTEDLNIALPSAQAVNFRLAFGHATLPFCFPSNVPRVTYTVTYREQILD